MPKQSLTISELTADEIRAFLESQMVGRLAYAFRDRVEIVPVHYVHHDGWLYGRTSFGPKLVTLQHSHWVAFEVDEVRSALEWTSVVLRGTFHTLPEGESQPQQRTYEEALRILRARYPETLTDADAVPFRTILFRIHIDEATGRRGAPSAG